MTRIYACSVQPLLFDGRLLVWQVVTYALLVNDIRGALPVMNRPTPQHTRHERGTT